MIILTQSNKDLSTKESTKIGSPSSFFKLKWIEEQERIKTFNHLDTKEIRNPFKDRLHVTNSKVSDFEKFQEIMESKRLSDTKIFTKLKAIIKPYQTLEFQKISEELEALDCLFLIQNKKIMNSQMIKTLTQSLKQIEKYCQKIKKEINNSMKKSRVKTEMTPSDMILKNKLGGDITSSNIFEEFSIIAKECQYLSEANNTDDYKRTSPLFPEMENQEIPLDYFIISLKNLFECVDLKNFKINDKSSELKTFCWEGVLQTPSICYTPYSTFLKAYKRCLSKPPAYFGLSHIVKENDFLITREKILVF